jgi:hypothetical protein
MFYFCRELIAKMPENPLVSHTIELLRHKRDLQKRLELIDEEGVVHKLEHLPSLKEEGHKSKLVIPNLPLTGRQAKELIQNRLPILLAHGGYTRNLFKFKFIDSRVSKYKVFVSSSQTQNNNQWRC